MSFSKSKRFNEKKDITPGPGYYKNEWGTIGGESIKHKIHTTPRFLERCKRSGNGRRLCIECTCVDIVTKTKSDELLLKTPPNYAVQNITFRGRNPKGAEWRTILRDLILFRRKYCEDQNIDTFVNEEYNQEMITSFDYEDFNQEMSMSLDVVHETVEEDKLSIHSTSSSAEDSGISSPTPSFKSTTECLENGRNQSTYDSMLSISTNASDEQPSTKDDEKNSTVLFLNDDNSKYVSNTLSTSGFYSDTIEKGSEGLMKILENILHGECKLADRIGETHLGQTFILESLQFLEKILMDQRKETRRILSLISLLEKKAIMMSSEQNLLGDKISHH